MYAGTKCRKICDSQHNIGIIPKPANTSNATRT